MAEVILEQVTKVFGKDVTAVDRLDLHVIDGEFLVLLGPSGCGKTTALRLIAGLETVTGGEISIGGRRVTDVPPRERDIAMVFQNYALYPHMTAFENIAFGLRLRRTPEEETKRLVRWAAETLGISRLLARRPKELSGGERQRVALGRALVRKPSVFLFDEPLSNLDAKLRVQMRHEILALHRRIDSTAVYVTHDQFEAMTMGRRIAVLKGGRLQQVAAPEDLYRRPRNRFVAEFIGTPGINIVRGEFVPEEGGRFRSASFSFAWPEAVPRPKRGTVDFGIRPEDIKLEPVPGGAEAACEVDRIEILGGEHHIYFACGEQKLVSRRSGVPAQNIRDAKNLTVYCMPEEGHFFDAESGETLLQRL
jgi:multiple sugar transport system ATP-binding protein